MKAYIYTEAIQFFIVVKTVPGGVIVNIWTTDTVLFLITAFPTKTLPEVAIQNQKHWVIQKMPSNSSH